MRAVRVTLVVGLPVALWLGCPKPAAVPDAAPAPVVDASADAGGWLQPAALEAWLAYQRALAALPQVSRGDAGPATARDDVRVRARAEAALRADAGLSLGEVDRIEALVAAVVTERTLARLVGADALAQFRGALAGLGDEQRQKAEAALSALDAKRDAGSLDAVEAEFGTDAVRLVLTREAEVTKTWDALLEARGGTR